MEFIRIRGVKMNTEQKIITEFDKLEKYDALTIPELSKLTGITRNTITNNIYKLIIKGLDKYSIKAYKLGNYQIFVKIK
jgi:transcriptional antiterminator